MNLKETLDGLAEGLRNTGVKTVFGDAVSVDGRTIIPVARVAYGFGSGGGGDPKAAGAGGGGGVRVIPAGVVEITEGQTRFVRFNDWRPLAAAAMIGIGVGLVLSRLAGQRR